MKKNYMLLLISAIVVVIAALFLMPGKSNECIDVKAEDVEEVKTGWVGEDGQWYYVNETTLEKESGFVEINGYQYYFDPITNLRHEGLLQLSEDEWYYMNTYGRMEKDCVIDNFVIDENGHIIRVFLNEEQLEERKQTYQPEIDAIMKKYGAVSGAVALIESGKVTNTWAYGEAVRGSVPMTADTKMRIASITKVVVAMNAMKLADEGILNLDESIGTYWGFPLYNGWYPDKPITMRSILSHTSSIADLNGYTNMEEKLKPNNIFRKVEPSNPSSYSYCNFAFCVGGTTLEKAANKTIYDISEEYFFEPMGIDASFAGGRIENKDLLSSLYYYDRSVARSKEAISNMMGSDVPGYDGSFMTGGLCISVTDLAKVISILVNDGEYEGKRYLSKEAVKTMETPYGPADYHGVQVTQCLPLKYNTNIYGEESLYFHTGSAYGAYTLFSYNPKTRNGVVVLTIGASGVCDEYGIYSVCGEISELMYNVTNSFMKNREKEVSVSENNLHEQNVSDNSLSGNLVLENSISENQIP